MLSTLGTVPNRFALPPPRCFPGGEQSSSAWMQNAPCSPKLKQHQKPHKGWNHAKCNSLGSACNYWGWRPAAAQPSLAAERVLLIQLALPRTLPWGWWAAGDQFPLTKTLAVSAQLSPIPSWAGVNQSTPVAQGHIGRAAARPQNPETHLHARADGHAGAATIGTPGTDPLPLLNGSNYIN